MGLPMTSTRLSTDVKLYGLGSQSTASLLQHGLSLTVTMGNMTERLDNCIASLVPMRYSTFWYPRRSQVRQSFIQNTTMKPQVLLDRICTSETDDAWVAPKIEVMQVRN